MRTAPTPAGVPVYGFRMREGTNVFYFHYDLNGSVIALTAGGPGTSSDMPAVFMTQMAFHRSEIGLASASAVVMFVTVMAVVVPYLYSELRSEDASR